MGQLSRPVTAQFSSKEHGADEAVLGCRVPAAVPVDVGVVRLRSAAGMVEATVSPGIMKGECEPRAFVVATMVRNVRELLQDWLAWHMMIGFEHFVVYNNNSTDGTVAALRHLVDAGGWVGECVHACCLLWLPTAPRAARSYAFYEVSTHVRHVLHMAFGFATVSQFLVTVVLLDAADVPTLIGCQGWRR